MILTDSGIVHRPLLHEQSIIIDVDYVLQNFQTDDETKNLILTGCVKATVEQYSVLFLLLGFHSSHYLSIVSY